VRLGESLDHRPETNESLKHTVRQGDACLQKLDFFALVFIKYVVLYSIFKQ